VGTVPGAKDASGVGKPPTWFLDRGLGRYDVRQALEQAGETVEIHDDRFPERTPDVDWLRLVSNNGWVALTKDPRIKDRPLERAAVKQGRVRVFTFVSSQVSGPDMARAFVQALPRMKRLLDDHEGPFIAKVYRDGTVKSWEDFDEDGAEDHAG